MRSAVHGAVTADLKEAEESLRAILRGRSDQPDVRNAIRGELQALQTSWQDKNLRALAHWLESLLKSKKRLGTLRAYLSDGLWLAQYAAGRDIADLGDDDVEAITEPDGRRHMSAWQSWRAHLKTTGVRDLHRCRSATRGANGSRVKKRCCRLRPCPQLFAALDGDARSPRSIAYFGMLRIDEALHLRPCDMALAGETPYLEIRNAKGGKSRRVYLTHAPATRSAGCANCNAARYGSARRARNPAAADVDKTALERQFRTRGWIDRHARHARFTICANHARRRWSDAALMCGRCRAGWDTRRWV